jgi:DNA-binding transcriptional LysR family regulator
VLGVPRATVSRRLQRLEERLGARLLRRTTRTLRLTDAGDALYRHARLVLDAVKQAEASVRRVDDAVRGDLRVTVPPVMTRGFYFMLCDFARRFPEVRLQALFTSRHIDLRRDGYDVALRGGIDFEPGLVSRTIARTEVLAVASPAYLAEHGTPKSAKDLKNHRCLLGFAAGGDVPQTHWPLKNGSKIQVQGNFVSNEVTLLGEAAVRGLGIAFLPGLFASPLIASGQLVQVLSGVVGASSRSAIVYPERQFTPPQVKAFIDAMAEWGRAELAAGELTMQHLIQVRPQASSSPVPRGKRAKRKASRR